MNEEYKKLAIELSNRTGWKICDINNGTFWIPWQDIGAFLSLEDAKKHSLCINEQNSVVWAYSLDDLKELIL